MDPLSVAIPSPLRYPGGKSRAIKKILPLIPGEFEEFREPMVGGGSVFFAVKQKFPNKKYWINDINEELYCFWRAARDENDKLVKKLFEIKQKYPLGRELYADFSKQKKNLTDFQKAIRFFVLNRITFSGLTESGGYSEQAFAKRFTDSSIERVKNIEPLLRGVKITNYDYQKVVQAPGKSVFIFLDPPYYSATDSELYGKKGDLHVNFEHERFASTMENCTHNWLITYDNCFETKRLFRFAQQKTEWRLPYAMTNLGKKRLSFGQELIITNYNLA